MGGTFNVISSNYLTLLVNFVIISIVSLVYCEKFNFGRLNFGAFIDTNPKTEHTNIVK